MPTRREEKNQTRPNVPSGAGGESAAKKHPECFRDRSFLVSPTLLRARPDEPFGRANVRIENGSIANTKAVRLAAKKTKLFACLSSL